MIHTQKYRDKKESKKKKKNTNNFQQRIFYFQFSPRRSQRVYTITYIYIYINTIFVLYYTEIIYDFIFFFISLLFCNPKRRLAKTPCVIVRPSGFILRKRPGVFHSRGNSSLVTGACASTSGTAAKSSTPNAKI